MLTDVKALILDMDGVLWKGDSPIGNLPSTFERAEALGLNVVFATNNSTRIAGEYVTKLASFGVTINEGQIITSAMATATYLDKGYEYGSSFYVIGGSGLSTEIKSKGFEINSQTANAVIVGLDCDLTYEKLKIATLILRSGKPLIGTNPDLTLPSPEGLIPGAGSIIAALEQAADEKAIIIGKPKPIMFEQALQRLGIQQENTLVVGDRLETDIAGGLAANCMTALVLSGVAREKDVENSPHKPGIIAKDLEEILGQL